MSSLNFNVSEGPRIHVGCMRFLLEVVDSVPRVLKALGVELVLNVAEYRRLKRMSQSPPNVGDGFLFIGKSV